MLFFPIFLFQLVQKIFNITQRTDPRLQLFQVLQQFSLRQLPQRRTADAVLGEQVVDELVDKGQRGALGALAPQLSPVLEKGLEGLVHVLAAAGEADVEGGQGAEVLEALAAEAEVLAQHVVAGAELQQLEQQTQERRGLLRRAVSTAYKGDMGHDPVYNVGLVETETRVLEVEAVDYALNHCLF